MVLGMDGDMCIYFTFDKEEFGEVKSIALKDNGENVFVTDENKEEYVQLYTKYLMTDSIKEQIEAFQKGFNEIIPREYTSIFNENDLELIISGTPDIDINDLKANTEYQNFNENDITIKWFWKAIDSFTKEEQAQFLQFVTGIIHICM